ncbi:lipoate--protein ligase family protein [Halococcus qingdaonensis]|uniref:lipoate--protein ligase family protein n=1 Tax=Halococcus qingdaonensis TaxID=224402 RepID=UPI002116CBA5|nr:biotin/lipoate A/B protein ligase family protein [Halococcus qingdaonensis]
MTGPGVTPDENWRIIDDGVHDEPTHHALDDVLIERLDDGEMAPTIRFWYRTGPAVPIGRFQAYADEVADEYVRDHDIDVVRRITGGGAMYAEPGAVITYSIYLPRAAVSDDIERSYERLNRWAIDALRDLGLAAVHEPLNDIAHEDGKIGGAAQLRRSNAVLHHVTMSYALDIEAMLRTLRIGEEKLSDKAVTSAEKRVTRIADYVAEDREAVIDHLKDEFRTTYGGEEGSLTDDELTTAKRRAETTFRTDEWNKRL